MKNIEEKGQRQWNKKCESFDLLWNTYCRAAGVEPPPAVDVDKKLPRSVQTGHVAVHTCGLNSIR